MITLISPKKKIIKKLEKEYRHYNKKLACLMFDFGVIRQILST